MKEAAIRGNSEVLRTLLEAGAATARQEAEFYQRAGDHQAEKGAYGEAIRFFEQAVPVLQRESGEDSLELAEGLFNLGIARLNVQEFGKAIQSLQQALPIFQENGDKRAALCEGAIAGARAAH